MNLLIPPIAHTFTGLFAFCLDTRKAVIVPLLLSCLLLCRGPKSHAGLARTIVSEERHRACFCKAYRRSRFNSRNIYADALETVMDPLVQEVGGKQVTWFVIIDGVCSRRGGFAKIENAIKYRKKKKDTGRSTKAHTFIQGLLITHLGVRLPLVRRTYYTREYCRAHGKKYVTMIDLAVRIIEGVVVPPTVRIVVLADEFFEGKSLDEVCTKHGYTYIVPVDKRRCFENSDGKRLSGKLHIHGVSMDRTKLTKIVLHPYAERTALLRRRTGSDKNKRVYFATSEVRCVSGLGDVTVVYSWKPQKRARRWKSKWFKALVSNATDLDVATLVEYYELRWQIEIFFRELKSFIGLTDFTGQDFAAYERFVDMVLLAYLFLEWFRLHLMSQARSRKQKASVQTARTGLLIRLFQNEADKASMDLLKSCAGNANKLARLFDCVNKRRSAMLPR
jgi:hypothetical protein